MKKKILITSTELMMLQFLIPHVKNLYDNGYTVEIACSEVGGRFGEVIECLASSCFEIHKVDLLRSPFAFKNLNGYIQLKKIINNGDFDLIWTNEPVMSVMTRLAAKKAKKIGTKVIYMTHGFHFYSGAPIINWLLYYPIEWLMASCADVIVAINREDYKRAKKFNIKMVRYIPGIGVDFSKFGNVAINREKKRNELGINIDKIVLLSVGELDKRKNQELVIKALGKIKNPNLFYLIIGKGKLVDYYKKLISKLRLEDNVKLLGYRKDIAEICKASDIFIHTSVREGLGIAPLEAMAVGLPLINTFVNGMRDYSINGKTGFSLPDPNDVDSIVDAISKMASDSDLREQCGKFNKEQVKVYSLENSKRIMCDIYSKL